MNRVNEVVISLDVASRNGRGWRVRRWGLKDERRKTLENAFALTIQSKPFLFYFLDSRIFGWRRAGNEVLFFSFLMVTSNKKPFFKEILCHSNPFPFIIIIYLIADFISSSHLLFELLSSFLLFFSVSFVTFFLYSYQCYLVSFLFFILFIFSWSIVLHSLFFRLLFFYCPYNVSFSN